MSIFDKFIRWCDKTPTVSGPTKEEIRKATKRLEREKLITKTVYGGSHVERPPRTDSPQLPIRKNYRFKYDYDYTLFNAPFPPTMEEMVRKGYINQIPSHWNKEIKEDKPMKRDIMKEIEWEYSEEGAKELRHLFAMWHLNDEVWQKQRRKAINLAVYGEEDPFNEKPYYHIVSFSDEYGFKLTQYPKHQKEEAHAVFNNYNEAWHTPNNILFFEGEEIGHIFLGGKV